MVFAGAIYEVLGVFGCDPYSFRERESVSERERERERESVVLSQPTTTNLILIS